MTTELLHSSAANMAPAPLPGKLDSAEALAVHLDHLVALDPRLVAVRDFAGAFPVRHAPAGFAGLCKIICGQQLSVASANAIWARFEQLPGATEAEGYLLVDEAAIRAVGMSFGKIRTMRTIAEAVAGGTLDFAHVETLPPREAVAYLVAHKGIGPWTAEVYLMFCAGHPDVFPAGDLALQKAVEWGLGLPERPSIKQLIAIAEAWAPHRATAALLFWRYFAASKSREGIVI